MIQAYLSYKGLFLWLNWPAFVSNVAIRPVLTLFMFALVGRFALDQDSAEYYMIGLSAHAVSGILLGGIIQGFFYERLFGTLSISFASRGSRALMYCSRCVLHLPNGFVAIACCLLAGWGLLDLSLADVNWIAVFPAVTAIVLGSAGFALFVGTFAIVFREWASLLAISTGLLLGLTGAVVPIEALPIVLEYIGRGLPLTHGLEELREVVRGDPLGLEHGGVIGMGVIREFAVGVGYGIAGYAMFRWIEIYAKRHGNLEASAG